jgi:hypothetical protein
MSSLKLRRYWRPALMALALLTLGGCVAYPSYGYGGYPGYAYPA